MCGGGGGDLERNVKLTFLVGKIAICEASLTWPVIRHAHAQH